METRHSCYDRVAQPRSKRLPVRDPPPRRRPEGNLLARARRLLASAIQRRSYLPATVAASLLLLYGLPTAVELLLLPYLNIWAASIIPGDLAGCLCIALLFRRPRTALVLYTLLTCLEAYLHLTYQLPATGIAWITDLVPSLVVSTLILRASSAVRVRDAVLS